MCKRLLCAFLLPLTLLASSSNEVFSVWKQAQQWPHHVTLRREFARLAQAKDVKAQVRVCEVATKIFPYDPIWNYNYACCLARTNKPEEALQKLDFAIACGFRKGDDIAKDPDFASLTNRPQFAQLVMKACATPEDQPVIGRPPLKNLMIRPGTTATLTETNLIFNMEMGLYEVFLDFYKPTKTFTELAPSYSQSKPDSPEKELLSKWLSENSAASNIADLYVNRDGGHSTIPIQDFPFLSAIRFDAQAHRDQADMDHPTMLFKGLPVFGNISRGLIDPVYWRSMARMSMTENGLAARMCALYLQNQLWVIPCVNDFGKPEIGDVFPANAPFQLVSEGISWSDAPFLRAALATSAAFRPLAKQALISRRLIAPTIQWLIRRTLKGVGPEEDYLTGQAHPVAFPARRLDLVTLVERAHALRPNEIPPVAGLSLMNLREQPIRMPVPVQDYADIMPETLYITPVAAAFVLRDYAPTRKFLFRACGLGTNEKTSFTWRVIHGNPEAVQILPPLQEKEEVLEQGLAMITLNRRLMTGRTDIACFARTPESSYGAPSIISFYCVPQEKRTWTKDGSLASIDYSNSENEYSDPLLALPRNWKDVFLYEKDGRYKGYRRSCEGVPLADFTPKGERIVEKTYDGAPKKVVKVKYMARQTGDSLRPQELTYLDEGEPYEVK